MALQLIKTIAPCHQYELHDFDAPLPWLTYNEWLIAPPRKYNASINRISQFFYAPVEDVYVVFLWTSILFWPGWDFYRVAWNASDGSVNEQYTGHEGANLFFSHWTGPISVGGYNKFYAPGAAYLEVKEVDWITSTWPGWKCFDWADRYPPCFSFAIVNRADKIVAGIAASPVIYIFNYETHELLGKVAIRDCGYSMAYESDKHLWVSHTTGELAKINYQTRRHEMLSKIENPTSEDLSYRCAFDTKRKILTILRHKSDAADGACRLQLEFYNPVPRAKILTAPVPLSTLQAGNKITFAAHVLGDGGEGIASQAVAAELAEPAAGTLDSNQLWSGLNGAVEVGYNAKEDAVETLILSTEV